MKFRKKPVEIEAIQWDGSPECFDSLVLFGAPVSVPSPGNKDIIVGTLEDGPSAQVQHYASVGDWIIKGIRNEFYPCKPDVFENSYDPVT